VNSPSIASVVAEKDLGNRDLLSNLDEAADLDDLIAFKIASDYANFYLEAQVHGGVLGSEVAKIAFRSGVSPSPDILTWAEQNNVEIEFY
jgi:hypothetical protein